MLQGLRGDDEAKPKQRVLKIEQIVRRRGEVGETLPERREFQKPW